MEIFIFWILLSVAVGIYASNKGRSGIGFFFLSLVTSPVVGLLFAIAVKSILKEIKPTPQNISTNYSDQLHWSEKPLDIGTSQTSIATDRDEVECPHCAEKILAKAKVCKHCGRDVAA